MKRKKTKTTGTIIAIFFVFLIYSVLIFLTTLLFNETSKFLYYWSLPIILVGIFGIIGVFVFVIAAIIDSLTKM